MIKRDQMQKDSSSLFHLGRTSVLAKPLVPNGLDSLRRTLRHEAVRVGWVRRRRLLLVWMLNHPHLVEHGRWVSRVWHLHADVVGHDLHLYADILGLLPVAKVGPLCLSGSILGLWSRVNLVKLVHDVVFKHCGLVDAAAQASVDFLCYLCRCCCAKFPSGTLQLPQCGLSDGGI